MPIIDAASSINLASLNISVVIPSELTEHKKLSALIETRIKVSIVACVSCFLSFHT